MPLPAPGSPGCSSVCDGISPVFVSASTWPYYCLSVSYSLVRTSVLMDLGPHSSVGKESACNAGDPGLIPGLGRSLGEGNGNPLQYSCLENPMDSGAWQSIVHGVAKSWTRLSE